MMYYYYNVAVCFLMSARLLTHRVDAHSIQHSDSTSDSSSDDVDKIIGGQLVRIGEHKYMAYVVFNDKYVGCGGTLISDRHVLTAAHCLMDPDTGVADDKEQVYFNVYTVEPMDSTAIKRIVYKSDFRIHAQYNYKAPGKGYDIAILKLNPPLSSAEMSKLDKIRLGDDDDLSWIQTLALGWGKTTDAESPGSPNFSPNLKQTKLKVLSRSECQAQWATNYNHDIQLCTAPSDTQICTGDSGGPLLWQKYEKIPGTSQFNWDKIYGYQAGIVSFSTGNGDSTSVVINRRKYYVELIRSVSIRATRCAQGSVLTRVQSFVNNGWIAANMN